MGGAAAVVLLGGSRWSEKACAAVARFAERFALPVATTFRRAHLFDALHPCYAGDLGIGVNPKLLARIKSADVIVAIGARLGEVPSQGYTLFEIPGPQQTFVHVHPGRRGTRPRLSSASCDQRRADGVCRRARGPAAAERQFRWRADTKTAHADYMAWSEKPTTVPGGVNPGEVMVWLRENLTAGRDPLQRRRQLQHLAASLLPRARLREPARSGVRLDGLRRAGGDRR